MKDENKTPVGSRQGKAQLINELAELRQRVAELEATEAERVRVEKGQVVDILESISDGFLTLEGDNLAITYFNKAAEQILGRRSEEVLGCNLFEAFPEAKGSIFEKEYTWAVKERAFTSFETYFGVKPYENWYEVKVYPYEGGISVYFQVATEHKRAEEALRSAHHELEMRVEERTAELAQANAALREEIAKRARAEEALRESEEHLQSLFETMTEGVVLITPDGQIVQANPAAERILGLNRPEIERRSYNAPDWEIFHPDGSRMPPEEMAGPRAMKEKRLVKDVVMGVKRPDGSISWINVSAVPLIDEAGKIEGVVGTFADITERVRAEETLRESEERFKLALEAATDGLYDWNMQTGEAYFSPRYYTMLGYEPYEMPASYDTWMNLLHPDDREHAVSTINEYIEWKRDSHEIEIRLRTKSGGWRWILSRGNVTERDADGRPIRMVGTHVDVTERVRAEKALRESNRRLEKALAELKATQERVVQQERLAAVGQLAAGVAHDFNNLLTSIIGFAELAHMHPDVPQAVQRDLTRIVKQGQRAAHLVRQILDFSRKSIRQPQPLDLVPFLKETAKFLERTIPEAIHIRPEIEPIECLVHADPTQLQQMVTNLAVNARDAMPKGGELTLRLSCLTSEPGERPPCSEMPPGEWTVLSVSDTGTGIPADVLPRIFEPFFTTKAPEGSGLGLAQVYGIVKQHQGYIDVESEVGKWTTFTICLPALAVGEEVPIEETREELRLGHGETVLLVEDEPAVLDAGQAMLERLDYQVLTAVNGEQALEVYAEHQNEIALVLADMVMPKMDGVALFQALKAQTPDVRMVMITGYPLDEEAQTILAEGIVDWLQKPMTFARLAQVVSQALRRQ